MRDTHLVVLFLFFVTFTFLWMYVVDEESTNVLRVDTKRVAVLIMNLGATDHYNRLDQITKTWGAEYPHLYFLTGDADVIAGFPNNTLTPPLDQDLTDRHRLFWGLQEVWNRFNGRLDWVLVCDDSTFIINDNLLRFLAPLKPSTPYYLGHRLAPKTYSDGSEIKLMFNSASLYALSSGVLKEFIPLLKESHECTRSHGGSSDLAVAECLSSQLGVLPRDTRDEQMRERFHVFQPATLLDCVGGIYKLPLDWYQDYKWNGVWTGAWAFSPSTVSFHFVSPGEMQALDFMLNMLNKRGHTTATEFINNANMWPTHFRDGFNEYILPGAEPVAELLLDIIKLDGPVDVVKTLTRTTDHAWRMNADNARNTPDAPDDDHVALDDVPPIDIV